MKGVNFNLARGLYVDANSFADVPDGVCEEALNIVLNRQGLITKRRGFDRVWSGSATRVFDYNGALFAIVGGDIYKCASGVPTTEITGSYDVSSIDYTIAGGNLYIATEQDVYKMSGSTASSITRSGVGKALNLSVSYFNARIGIHQVNSQVGYRVLFGYTDNNNNKIIGAPSAFQSITNANKAATAFVSGGLVYATSAGHGMQVADNVIITNAKDASGADVTGVNGTYTLTYVNTNEFRFLLTASPSGTLATLDFCFEKTPVVKSTLPDGITTDHFVQVFRSSQTSDDSIPPIEDLQLVDEVKITTTDIANGYIEYKDEIPDSFLGAYLYTNPSQESIAQANNPPPACSSIATFRNCVFYANVKELAGKRLTLVSVDAMTNGNRIVIKVDGTEHFYTAGASEAGNTFYLKKDSSVSINLDTTSRSLCNVINADTSNPVKAYYISGVNEAPAQMFIEANSYEVDEFSIYAEDGGVEQCFSPFIGLDDDSYIAYKQSYSNRVFFSKIQESEAVPAVNFLDIGNSSTVIKRIVPLRDSLIVLTNQGVYRVSGDVPSDFNYRLIDSSVECVAPRTATVLNDNVFFLARQGICACSENSVTVVSQNINNYLINAIDGGSIEDAVGFSYPSENYYMLCCNKPNSSDKTVYVYDSMSGTIVESDAVFSDCILHSNKQVRLQDGIHFERKERRNTDYADSLGEIVTVTEIEDTNKIIVLSGVELQVGMALRNSGYFFVSEVEALPLNLYRVTFESSIDVEVDDELIVDRPIVSRITSAPFVGDDISLLKVIPEIQFNFRNDISCSELSVSFENQDTESSLFKLQSYRRYVGATSGWGSTPWGSGGFGDSDTYQLDYITRSSNMMRTYLPSGLVRSKWLQVTIEHSLIEPIELQAISLMYSNGSGRKHSR